MGLIYGCMIFFWFHHILIHATSFIGSFLVLFGIGLVAGHYPNPFIIVQLINNGQLTSIDPAFYGYFAGNIVLYIIGCIYQYRVFNAKAKLVNDLKDLKGSTLSSSLEVPINNSKNAKDLFKSESFKV